ncbi:hypothetical protein HU200_059727 [Digitaria exilis]|uniref:Uncharacterized protein n=1 Tax=Digitaria exilis TaxID=1010633 RepID=A0A835E2X0_9POAL|nr:hypothetical protein HU200_059727 [Digitaria exilis]
MSVCPHNGTREQSKTATSQSRSLAGRMRQDCQNHEMIDDCPETTPSVHQSLPPGPGHPVRARPDRAVPVTQIVHAAGVSLAGWALAWWQYVGQILFRPSPCALVKATRTKMQKAANNFPLLLSLPISHRRGRSMAPASRRRRRVPSSPRAQPTSTFHAGAPPHSRRSSVLVIPGPDAMDRLLLSRPPLPVPTHAAAPGADGDLLELDVLWPSGASSIGLGLLAALPEDEGKKKKRAAGGGVGGPVRSAARPIPEAAALAASGMARSAPVRIPSEPSRRGRWAQAAQGGGWDDAGETMVPPHEIVARRAAAHSSVLEGAGRTLKGRDLRRVRNAVLRRTGFLD